MTTKSEQIHMPKGIPKISEGDLVGTHLNLVDWSQLWNVSPMASKQFTLQVGAKVSPNVFYQGLKGWRM